MKSVARRRFSTVLNQAIRIAEAEGCHEQAAQLVAIRKSVRPQPSQDDPRVVARRLGSFTATELADALGRSRVTAVSIIRRLVELGVIRDTGLRQRHEGPGRPAPVFEAVPIVAVSRPRDRRPPPEVEVVKGGFKPRGPATGGKGRRIQNRDVRQLLDKAKAHGCQIEHTNSSHIRILTPKGGTVILPSTPSDHRALLNARAELRRSGVKV